MTNKEMLDIAKNKMIEVIEEYRGDVKAEAAKALALLIMAENETKLPNNIREVLD